MKAVNAGFANIGLDVSKADEFVDERLDGIRNALEDLLSLRSYGHLLPKEYLPSSREFLSAVGEAHSAFNSVEILKARGVAARLLDLTGWREAEALPLECAIRKAFDTVDLSKEIAIVTGYVKCDEGMVRIFDRGYSEITFSKICVVTRAREGIIHKEFHLCTGHPVLLGLDKVKIIGNTNFDIADQLSDMDMEAIHSKASKEMELMRIPIRVKNAFDPDHPGTLIEAGYVSPTPKVDMICGRDDVIGIEVFDPEMVGQIGYDHKLLKFFVDFGVSYIAKNTNANTITHYIPAKTKNVREMVKSIIEAFPGASVQCKNVAIVCVIGTNMKFPGFLSRAASALAGEGINVLALDQCMRQVTIQFMIEREDFAKAQIALHREFVES